MSVFNILTVLRRKIIRLDLYRYNKILFLNISLQNFARICAQIFYIWMLNINEIGLLILKLEEKEYLGISVTRFTRFVYNSFAHLIISNNPYRWSNIYISTLFRTYNDLFREREVISWMTLSDRLNLFHSRWMLALLSQMKKGFISRKYG